MLLPMVGNGNVGLHCNASEGHSCIRWVWAILMSYDVNISTHTHMCTCVHTLCHTHIYYIRPIMISTAITLSPCSFFFKMRIVKILSS